MPVDVTQPPADNADLLPLIGESIRTQNNHYEILKLLGRGGFGAVFEAKRNGDHFAVKVELEGIERSVLSMDLRVLRAAQTIHSPHFCSLLDRGKVVKRFRYVVMSLCGHNLWDVRFERPGHRFSLSTSLKAAEQCLVAIEDLHQLGYLHRDVKSSNFAIGRSEVGEQQIVHILDFGLSRCFLAYGSARRSSAPFRGTTRYASISTLKQEEQSRKDDVEAWLYCVVEWTAGGLPWSRVTGTKERQEILEWKQRVRDGEQLDRFLANCPKEHFHEMLKHLDTLTYESVPRYAFFHECLQKAADAHNVMPNEPLDWDPDRPYCGPRRERPPNQPPARPNEEVAEEATQQDE